MRDLSLKDEVTTDEGKQPLLLDIGVIALVPDAWEDFWQTRHHVVSRLSQYFQVMWVYPDEDSGKLFKSGDATSNGAGKNGAGAGRSIGSGASSGSGFMVYRPNFWLKRLYRFPRLDSLLMQARTRRARRILERRGCKKIILYIWRPSLVPAVESVPFDLSCYHIDDSYSFSDVELPLSEVEGRLIRDSDQVYLHSLGLLEKKGSINPHTMFVPNGVDFRAYSKRLPEPPDLAAIPRPRIGYTGFIKKHLDWQLLSQLSLDHPEWSFVLVGPQSPHDDIVKTVQELSRRPNVYFLGAKPTPLLCAYPQHFDVCIMPYQANDYTKYVYPLKLHEYLASGSPTVGTRIRTLSEFSDVVALASTAEEWSAAIKTSLGPEANSPERRLARQEVAQQFDWERLVLKIATGMAEGLGKDYADRLSESLRADGKPKPDLSAYRSSAREQERISDLMVSVPDGFRSVLDIGARDGYISNLLTQKFAEVTALDLEMPEVSNEKVITVTGDITKLNYPDNAFDVVVCTEVLEHIPPQLLEQACRETSRVAKHAVIVGVPYKQDRRMGATYCVFCREQNPCWGHVNDFDEARLKRLFSGLTATRTSFIAQTKDRTNAASAYLMGKARNPWGTYEQDEACVHCGNRMIQPSGRTLIEGVYGRLASMLNFAQSKFVPWRPMWIHMVFRKDGVSGTPKKP
jgi:glycosyltransferase involved in cell wall biosynthesis